MTSPFPFAVLLSALLLLPSAGHAADQTLPGKKLLLGTKENKPRKRRVNLLAKDKQLSIGAGQGSADDPTIHGGALRIRSLSAGFDDTYALPAGGWKPFSKKDPSKGWKYVKGDPIVKVFVRTGKKLQVLGKGAGLGHMLDVDPDPVEVELTIGDRRYCLRFDGKPRFRPGAKFLAKNAPAPDSCPGVTTTSVTTTTTSPSVTTTTNQPPTIVSTAPGDDVLLDQTTQQVDLSTWTGVLSSATSSGGNPSWQVAEDGLSVLQTNNSNPGFFLSDFALSEGIIEGTFTVETTNDDDIIGFVFGFQDINHFYLFDWKQTDQAFCGGFADAGMTLKLVAANTDLVCVDLWNTDGTPGRVTNLYHNTIPWADNTTYRFVLGVQPGSLHIEMWEGPTLLDAFTVEDSTYPSGSFGFYNNSQNAVRYTGFTETTVIAGSFTYDVDATDPEAAPITYALTQAPTGMAIDPTTGIVTWMPDGSDLGSHEVTVRATDASGGFDEQTFTVVVALNTT